MRHLHLSTTTTTMAPSTSLRKPSTNKTPTPHNHPNCPSLCCHSPSATLHILIFVLVLFSGACLIVSCFSHIFHSLSLILPPFSTLVSHFHRHSSSDHRSQLMFFTLFIVSFVAFVCFFEICCGHRSRRCERKGCTGLKKAMEFDLLLQGEELLRCGDGNKAVKDVNELPWKGESEDNPDYECLRAELRKVAPPNGRARAALSRQMWMSGGQASRLGA